MAVAAKTKAAPRTTTRDEPEARAPERAQPARDPNTIYTRDGRPIEMERIKNQNSDYSDLASFGIVPPDGWVYGWRTVSVKNAPAIQEIADDESRGWTPVPASRHPGKIMPRGFDGAIQYGAMMLKERPAQAEAYSRQQERMAAQSQLNISRSMTGLMQRASPNSDMLFEQDATAQRGTGVKIERIPMGDPNRSKNYNYTLEE